MALASDGPAVWRSWINERHRISWLGPGNAAERVRKPDEQFFERETFEHQRFTYGNLFEPTHVCTFDTYRIEHKVLRCFAFFYGSGRPRYIVGWPSIAVAAWGLTPPASR